MPWENCSGRTGKIQSPSYWHDQGKRIAQRCCHHKNPEAAWELCLELMKNGLLAKPTRGDKVRLRPPLVINRDQVLECARIIEKACTLD